MKNNIVNFSTLELTKTLNAKLFTEPEINELAKEEDYVNKNIAIMEKFKNYPEKFNDARIKLKLIYSLSLKNLEDYGITVTSKSVNFKPKNNLKQKELYIHLYLIENKIIKLFMNEQLIEMNKKIKEIKNEIEFLEQFREKEKNK